MPAPAQQSVPPGEEPDNPPLPVEIEIYVNPDGSVTFADLEASVIALARRLNPDQPLACDVPADQPAVRENSDSGGRNDE